MIPKLLKEIPDPPKELFILGELPADEFPKIAVVGTRKATDYGKRMAKEMAFGLARQGFVIVSGLAVGIDTASHEGCLEAGGRTVAVLACGLDKIYPAQNENLAKRILAAHGAIISEYPEGAPAYKNNFLTRNRLISGLSIATIIIEAPLRSGSISTAGHAAEQGREVLVLPGPAGHRNFAGSHRLIRDGARLIESVNDVLEDLGLKNLAPTDNNQALPKDLASFELDVFETIKKSGRPLSVDKLQELTKLEPRIISRAISRLLVESLIKEESGGYVV
jgi:DNA processing protein